MTARKRADAAPANQAGMFAIAAAIDRIADLFRMVIDEDRQEQVERKRLAAAKEAAA